MKRVMRFRLIYLCLAAVLGLVACGGGGGGGGSRGGGTAAIPQLPPVASLGVQTFQSNLGTGPAAVTSYTTDAEFSAYYALASIKADAAYRRGYFGQGQTIAIMDEGFDPNHPDLVNQIVSPANAALIPPITLVSEEYERTIHGTYAALLVAGERGNGVSFPADYRIPVQNPGTIPSPRAHNLHGVAPQARIMPIQIRGGIDPFSAINSYVLPNPDVSIVSSSIGLIESYSGRFEGRDGAWLISGGLPVFRPIFGELDPSTPANMIALGAELTRTNRDIVFVWPTGNDQWHSGDRIDACGNVYDGTESFTDAILKPGCGVGTRNISQQEFLDEFERFTEKYNTDGSPIFEKIDWDADGYGRDYNDPGGLALGPLYAPGLIGKWLAVGGLGVFSDGSQRIFDDSTISEFSNGCGVTKLWCLFAPAREIEIAVAKKISGTSFSTPLVAGALAVLKSRFPTMPTVVVAAVMLKSATPLGSRNSIDDPPDDVYGWGALNLENAINMQGTVSLLRAVPSSAPGIRALDARINLPAGWGGVQKQLAGVQVAVDGVGGAYYNAKLSDFAQVKPTSGPLLGTAAMGMLRPEQRISTGSFFAAFDNTNYRPQYIGADLSAGALGGWRVRHDFCDSCDTSPWREWDTDSFSDSFDKVAAPFFDANSDVLSVRMNGTGLRPFASISGKSKRFDDNATDDDYAPYRQLGLRWSGGDRGFGYAMEMSRIDEKDTFWGASMGDFGSAAARTWSRRIALHGQAAPNWRAFAAWQEFDGEADDGKSYLSQVSDLRNTQWSAGVQGRDVFLDNDVLRFSVRRESGVRGRAVFRHQVVRGSFAEAFYYGKPQTLEVRETAIHLKSEPRSTMSLGYRMSSRRGAHWALGLEHETADNQSAISMQYIKTF